jgi:hypothetical protein
LERSFPAHHKWLLRVVVDNASIGAKDISLEVVSAALTLMIKDGKILIQLDDLRVKTLMFQFRVKGLGLGKILSPELVYKHITWHHISQHLLS